MDTKEMKDLLTLAFKRYRNFYRASKALNMYSFEISRFFNNFENQKISKVLKIAEKLDLEIIIRKKESSIIDNS